MPMMSLVVEDSLDGDGSDKPTNTLGTKMVLCDL